MPIPKLAFQTLDIGALKSRLKPTQEAFTQWAHIRGPSKQLLDPLEELSTPQRQSRQSLSPDPGPSTPSHWIQPHLQVWVTSSHSRSLLQAQRKSWTSIWSVCSLQRTTVDLTVCESILWLLSKSSILVFWDFLAGITLREALVAGNGSGQILLVISQKGQAGKERGDTTILMALDWLSICR